MYRGSFLLPGLKGPRYLRIRDEDVIPQMPEFVPVDLRERGVAPGRQHKDAGAGSVMPELGGYSKIFIAVKAAVQVKDLPGFVFAGFAVSGYRPGHRRVPERLCIDKVKSAMDGRWGG